MKTRTNKFFMFCFIVLFFISLCFTVLLYFTDKMSCADDAGIISSLSILTQWISLIMCVVHEIITRKIDYSLSFSKFEWFIFILLGVNLAIRMICIKINGNTFENFAHFEIASSLILSFAGIVKTKLILGMQHKIQGNTENDSLC